MTMIKVVEPTETEIMLLAENPRPEEVEEVWASHNHDIQEAVRAGLRRSADAIGVYRDNVFQGIVGVVPISFMGDYASPWMLTTKDVSKHPRILLGYTKKVISHWHKRWPVLENWIDARYEASIRWAKWAGFTVYEAQPYGVEQLPFHRVRSEQWVQQPR